MTPAGKVASEALDSYAASTAKAKRHGALLRNAAAASDIPLDDSQT
jgi:hypothetical protein